MTFTCSHALMLDLKTLKSICLQGSSLSQTVMLHGYNEEVAHLRTLKDLFLKILEGRIVGC